MRFSHKLSLLLSVFLAACGTGEKTQNQDGKQLRIAAASSLSPVLDSVAVEFEKATGIHCQIQYGATGTLLTQITGGMEVDVFLPVGMGIARKLDSLQIENNYTASFTVWLMMPSVENDTRSWQRVLEEADHIAIPNPVTAPLGTFFVSRMNQAYPESWEKIKDKLVFAETASQVNHLVEAGHADVGVVGPCLQWVMAKRKEFTFVEMEPEGHDIPMYFAILSRQEQARQLELFFQLPKARRLFQLAHIHLLRY